MKNDTESEVSESHTIQISSNFSSKFKEITYEGELRDGLRSGFGKLYEDGTLVYEGNFALSVFEGKGKKYYPNGKLMYVGSFSNGFMDGPGKLYREDGTLWYEAQFTNESIQGRGTIYFPDGHRLEVGFEDGLPTMREFEPEGTGIEYDRDGTIYHQGQFHEGKPVKNN